MNSHRTNSRPTSSHPHCGTTETIHNPELPFPDLGEIEGLVVKKDINYGLQNVGTVATTYVFDFEMIDETVRDLLQSGQIVAQVVVWQDKKVIDAQFCEPRIISENRIIARDHRLSTSSIS